MTSKCPKCNESIEHEDYLFEVQCPNCNVRFNPFMLIEDSAGEPQQLESEGKSALDEIRAFGETLQDPEPSSTTQNTGSTEKSVKREIPRTPVSTGSTVFCFGGLKTPPENYELMAPLAVFVEYPSDDPINEALGRLSTLASQNQHDILLQTQWIHTEKGIGLVATPAKLR